MLKPMRAIALVATAGALTACSQPDAPPRVGPPAADAAPAMPDLRPFADTSFDVFTANAANSRFWPPVALTEAEQARFAVAMAQSAPAQLVGGGGAEALVFRGCAAAGCDAGRGVYAIDLSTGATFVGVTDADGTSALAPNDLLEALLRLSSPHRAWDDAPELPPSPPSTAP